MTSITYWDGFNRPPYFGWHIGGTYQLGYFDDAGGRYGGCWVKTDSHQYLTGGYGSADVIGFAIKPGGIGIPQKLFCLWGPCTWESNVATIHHAANLHAGHLYNRGGLTINEGNLIWQPQEISGYGLPDPHIEHYTFYVAPSIRINAWTHIEIQFPNKNQSMLWLNGKYCGMFGTDVWNYANIYYRSGDVCSCCGPGICCLPNHEPKHHNLFHFGGKTTWVRTDFPALCFDDYYGGDFIDGTPVGDLVAHLYWPNAIGNYNEWSPIGGSNHYSLVNEEPHDEDDTYVYAPEADSVGIRDSYVFDIPDKPATPLSVWPRYIIKKTNVGLRTLASLARLSGTDKYITPFVVYATPWGQYYTYPYGVWEGQTFETDPSNNPWTWANLRNTEFGMKVES